MPLRGKLSTGHQGVCTCVTCKGMFDVITNVEKMFAH